MSFATFVRSTSPFALLLGGLLTAGIGLGWKKLAKKEAAVGSWLAAVAATAAVLAALFSALPCVVGGVIPDFARNLSRCRRALSWKDSLRCIVSP